VVKPLRPKPGQHADITRILDGKLDYDADSRKDVGVDVDRLYVAPPSNPEWAAEPEYDAMRFGYRQLVERYGAAALATHYAKMRPETSVATQGIRYFLSLVQIGVNILLTAFVPMFKLTIPTRGLRLSHRLGVGCNATLRISPNPNLPFHSSFFSKEGSYESCVRFAQTSYHDNSALDVKSLSLKVFDGCKNNKPASERSSVFDLVMQSCPASVIYSLRFWMLQTMPFAALRGDAAKLRASWKRFAHAFWPGSVRLTSRDLRSFADNTVYAKSRFHLTDDHGKAWVVTFRALPVSVADENHPDPSLWMGKEDIHVMSERNLRYANDDRPADYLITELKDRLAPADPSDGTDEAKEKKAPVAFRLQMQCRPLEPHHTTTSEEV
jgi:hypothetical protein